MTKQNNIKTDVLIVDDHDLVRVAIRRLLEDFTDNIRVAEAASGEEALELVRELQPDVILMDIHMPGLGGLETTRKLLQRQPELKIIILTAISEGPMPKALLSAGAVGYITKGCSLEEMVNAIKKVKAGHKYIAAEVAQQLALSMLDGKDTSPFEKLSHRELQLVLLVSQGLRNSEISDVMCISPKTVSTYRTRVMQKLNVNTSAELATLAVAHGLTERLS